MSIKIKKNVRGTLAEFLGNKLDMVWMEACLPSSKLFNTKKFVARILNKQTITRQDLQSLLDFPSFACRIVVLGQLFLRRLFTALAQKKQFYSIDFDMRADL